MISKKMKSIIISVTMSFTLLFSGTVFADGSQVKVNVERLAGQDRYETNSKIVDKGWKSADNVILCNGSAYADAIVASPLSKKLNAPILLAQSSNDMYVALQEIQKLGAKNIYILGGTGVISSAMENGLKNQGYNVTRIAGNSRYETSIEVAKYVNSNPSTIFFTDGDNWEDALSIAPVAAKLQAPIILGSRTNSSDKVNNYLANVKSSKITILDDNAFSGTKGVNETSGLVGSKLLIANNPLDMNENIIKQYKDQLNFNNVYLASSSTFADALSGSGLASIGDNPIILYNRDNRSSTYNIFNSNKNSIQNVEVLGGEGAIGDDGISNVFDITGLVESTDGNTTNNNSSNTNNGDNDQGNINPTNTSDGINFTNVYNSIKKANFVDYYSFINKDEIGSFSNFNDKGLVISLYNNDIIQIINNGTSNTSNNNIYGFFKLVGNSKYINLIDHFLVNSLNNAESASSNVDSHKGIVTIKYSTNNSLIDNPTIVIEYNKDINKFELYIQNYSYLPDNVKQALKNYGYSIISNNNSQVYQDCIYANNLNSESIEKGYANDSLKYNNNSPTFTGNNEQYTTYGKYINELYVLRGKLNNFVVFVSSDIN